MRVAGLVGGQVRIDFLTVVVVVGQGIVNRGEGEMGIRTQKVVGLMLAEETAEAAQQFWHG